MKHPTMYEDISVTSLTHRVLADLAPAPFHDLCAKDYTDNCEFYSYDTFRRLYNDAVESMLHYKSLAEKNRMEADDLTSRCHELECCIRELANTDD